MISENYRQHGGYLKSICYSISVTELKECTAQKKTHQVTISGCILGIIDLAVDVAMAITYVIVIHKFCINGTVKPVGSIFIEVKANVTLKKIPLHYEGKHKLHHTKAIIQNKDRQIFHHR